MELWIERALAEDVTMRPAVPDEVLVLSQEDFTDAVRQALRDLRRPELLCRNPLIRTRLAHDYATPISRTRKRWRGCYWPR